MLHDPKGVLHALPTVNGSVDVVDDECYHHTAPEDDMMDNRLRREKREGGRGERERERGREREGGRKVGGRETIKQRKLFFCE